MVKVEYTGMFYRHLEELLTESEGLQEEIDKRILWFRKNPEDTRLGVHVLHKRMKGKWAIEVTDNIRIVFEWIGKTTARFLAIGGHEQVYKKYSKTESVA